MFNLYVEFSAVHKLCSESGNYYGYMFGDILVFDSQQCGINSGLSSGCLTVSLAPDWSLEEEVRRCIRRSGSRPLEWLAADR
jgi:hypothetical protein